MQQYKKLEFLENISLYDSKLEIISIYKKINFVEIEIILQVCYPNKMFLKLLFKDVFDYSLSWNSDFDFYIIDSYKLLISEKNIYCSFDPFDEELGACMEDNDIIKSKEIEIHRSYDVKFLKFERVSFI